MHRAPCFQAMSPTLPRTHSSSRAPARSPSVDDTQNSPARFPHARARRTRGHRYQCWNPSPGIQYGESGRRPEDCRTPKAGAIADTMHVRERVTERGV
jgi:hypothetical protein